MAVMRSAVLRALCICIGMSPAAAYAVTFDLEYGDGISGTLNTVLTAGAAMRTQRRASDLVGKGNLDPFVCAEQYQSCQGTFRDQHHPAARGAAAPGMASYNFDDGNWNYDQHDLVQAPVKVTQDLTLTYGDYGFFGKWMYFYDFVNNDFTNFHPNRLTSDNRDRVGTTGGPNNNLFTRVYGPGEVVREPRSNGEVLRQIGTDLQMMDYYFYGTLPLFEEQYITFKLGNQTLNWGESTVLLINSLNQVNPVNANNLVRVGFDLSELFIPTGMVYLSTELAEAVTIEAFYGYEWQPLEIFAPGSFYSFLDFGTNDAIDFAGLNFGTNVEDPERIGAPTENPLSGLTPTTVAIERRPDVEARDNGQYGVSLKYFAEWLNNGTELGFYFLNYHSKLPYVSLFASDASCARREGNDLGLDAANGFELLAACPDLPASRPNNPVESPKGPPEEATSDAVPFDTVDFVVEYPEDIQMFGVSFNTTIGDISLQGEVAYRPDMPVQVETVDLAFHAVGPTLSRCHDPDLGCTGTTGGVGPDESGATVSYMSSDFAAYPGSPAVGNEYADTFDLAAGAAVGSARSFPSFIGAYRGVAPGETPPNSYVRGWEFFDVWQFNLGGTYIQGSTDFLSQAILADQIIFLFEVGAQWVPDLPGTDVLQIEAPATDFHASAGADGSGTGNYRQDCAHTVDCHYSGVRTDGSTFGEAGVNGTYGDGLRFNPHQEDHEAFADDFSVGYALVTLIRYESVFPGISFAPITIFQHDVYGTSVDSAAQFTEGRMDIQTLVETRYKESLSFNVGYWWFTGGGRHNLQRDRDQALAYVRYLF